MDPLTELHQGVLVEPQPGDVARDRLVQDRLGRRAERGALRLQQEPLELGVEVELRVGLHQVVDQADRQGAGGQADLLVDVPVDDVVLPRDAGAAGLAAADVVAGLLLQLQGDVLGDVPQPGALLEPLEEPAAVPREQECRATPGRASSSPSTKPGIVLVG